MSFEIPQDNVTINISVEEAIVSDTVKATINVALSTTSEDATDVRSTILDALKSVLDTEWAFTRLDRHSSASGLEEVHATATARIPEAKAAGLVEKTKIASRQGLQLTAGALDYNPARNVVDDKIKDLRKAIYMKAQEEAAILNETVNDGAAGRWRVGMIEFSGGNVFANNSRGMMLEATSYSAPKGGAGESGLDLTQKVSLTATVALQRVVLSESL